MLSVTVGSASRLRGAKLINWLQDLYPEVASQAQIGNGAGLMGALRRARNHSLRLAAANVAIASWRGYGAPNLPKRTSRPNASPRSSNWSNDTAIQPPSGTNPSLREGVGPRTARLLSGISGNLGTAHDADTLTAAAEKLRARTDIAFLVIGGGSMARCAQTGT